MNYTEKQINNLLEGIYAGDIDINSLPVDLYKAVSGFLVSGLGKIKGSISEAMTRELTSNLQIFSGAKVYQSVREMSLLKDNETIKTFSEFKKEAEQTFDQYYKQWAQAEYNTTIGQAQMVERWEQIEKQKETLPFLKYSAVIDTQTSEICLPLDGICLPVNDSFWDSNTPLNHFNCRCTIEQLDEFDAVVTEQSKVDEASKEMDGKREDLFNSNPYKDRAIFNETHPYFDIPKQDIGSVLQLVDAFIPSASTAEAEQNILNIFNENLGIKAKSVKFAESLNLEDINQRSEQLYNLTKEYNTSFKVSSEPIIKFESTSRNYGSISYFYDGKLDSLNFGNKFDSLRAVEERAVLKDGIIKTSAKSKVDFENLNISTLTHEFGHIISVTEISNNYDGYYDFWGEMTKIKRKYSLEVNKLAKAKDVEALNKMYLGDYARTNIKEFMAEGFTEYKLKTNPSKYAQEIGLTIDKYFKK